MKPPFPTAEVKDEASSRWPPLSSRRTRARASLLELNGVLRDAHTLLNRRHLSASYKQSVYIQTADIISRRVAASNEVLAYLSSSWPHLQLSLLRARQEALELERLLRSAALLLAEPPL